MSFDHRSGPVWLFYLSAYDLWYSRVYLAELRVIVRRLTSDHHLIICHQQCDKFYVLEPPPEHLGGFSGAVQFPFCDVRHSAVSILHPLPHYPTGRRTAGGCVLRMIPLRTVAITIQTRAPSPLSLARSGRSRPSMFCVLHPPGGGVGSHGGFLMQCGSRKFAYEP